MDRTTIDAEVWRGICEDMVEMVLRCRRCRGAVVVQKCDKKCRCRCADMQICTRCAGAMMQQSCRGAGADI
jgi:superfamily II helicase